MEAERRIARAVTTIADALVAVSPISQALAKVRVAVSAREISGRSRLTAFGSVISELTSLLELRPVEVIGDVAQLDAVELAISLRLRLDQWTDVIDLAAALPGETLASLAAPSAEPQWEMCSVTAADRAVLQCYATGEPGTPPILVVGACGMPVGLISGWLQGLATSHRVVTWESRGLFSDVEGFDSIGWDITAQVEDMAAVLEAFDLDKVHVLGLCGGAPIALAGSHSPCVGSLSLWHGDFALGDAAPRTTHQQDMQSMLRMAGGGREQARAIHELFRRQGIVAGLPSVIAHYLLYPYATVELLYRYGKLNGAIMNTDCRPFLKGLRKPCLVVTSEQDTTAHPQVAIQLVRL